jgi:tungstate transport system ATP-binding protein
VSAVLSARGLRASHEGRPSAELEALEVGAGKAVALVGPNGSGKSTLLRVLALLERPEAGEVALLGTPVGPAAEERDRRRRDVTLALPHPWLFVGSALQNVERGLTARGVPRPERRVRAMRALADLGVEHLAGRDAKRLSTGESARVALARALVLETPVLLLDEPFAHLDPGAIPAARAAIERRLAAGAAVVAAAVDPRDLDGLARRVVEVRAPTSRT